MGFGTFVLTVGALAATLVTGAETRNYEQWVGVWQGELDGQTGVTVTLGRDGGDLEGTIVFNVVERDGGQARVIGHDAHVLIRVRVDENALGFQVIRSSDARELHLTMRLTAQGKAQLECGDCGGPPATELLRIR
jgi:hypothetical protein